jgi:hypothetical protein
MGFYPGDGNSRWCRIPVSSSQTTRPFIPYNPNVRIAYRKLNRVYWHFISLRYTLNYRFVFPRDATATRGADLLIIEDSLLYAIKHIRLGGTPLEKWAARHRELYITTHNPHNRKTSMPKAKFEPTIPACKRQWTRALDRAATGIVWFKFRRNTCHAEDGTFISGLQSLTEPDTSLLLLSSRGV